MNAFRDLKHPRDTFSSGHLGIRSNMVIFVVLLCVFCMFQISEHILLPLPLMHNHCKHWGGTTLIPRVQMQKHYGWLNIYCMQVNRATLVSKGNIPLRSQKLSNLGPSGDSDSAAVVSII